MAYEYPTPTILEIDIDASREREAQQVKYNSKGNFGQWLMLNGDTVKNTAGTVGGILSGLFGNKQTVQQPYATIPTETVDTNKKLYIGIAAAFVILVVVILVIKKSK